VEEAHPTSPKPLPVDEVVEQPNPTSPKPLPVDEVVEQPNPTSPKPLQSATSAENVDVTPHVIISPSPPKYDPNVWLPSLDLYVRDKAILQSTGWHNDGIILAAQKLLEAQTRGKVFGWQSTQLSKRKGLFVVVPRCSPFVQILHVGKCHWLTTSNVNVHGGASYIDTVCIYDSGRPTTVSTDVTRSVCSFYKCLGERVRFDIMNVSPQTNAHDCGVYAIAYATELAYGADPITCNWDVGQMRGHLLQCLESGLLTRFPRLPSQRRIRLGTRVRKSSTFQLYCTCRTINDDSKSMIECVRCRKWYHKQCMSLDDGQSYCDVQWKCIDCNNSTGV
jgi:hypothetical protein